MSERVDPFAPASAGDISPFLKSLNTVNSAMEVLRNLPSPRGQLRAAGDEVNQRLPTPHASCLVRNDTGAAVASLSILKLGESVSDIAQQPHDVFRMPAFEGTTPAAQSDCFGVLMEGVGAGRIAQCAIRGVAVCYVNVTNTAHKWAAPDPGSSAQLLSGEAGPARILTTPAGTGRQLCAVLIDDRGDRLVRMEVDETAVNGEPATTISVYASDEPTTTTPVIQYQVANNYSGGNEGGYVAFYPLGTAGDAAWTMSFVTNGSEPTSVTQTWNLNNQTATLTTTESGGDIIQTWSSGQQLVASAATVVGFTSATSGWTKYTKTFSDLSAAAVTNDIELFSLAAKGVIEAVVIKHSAAFTGGSISNYTLSVGTASSLATFSNSSTGSTFSVFGAPGDTSFHIGGAASGYFGMVNFGSATSIRLAATATGDNLDAATAGSVDVWVKTSTLP